MGYTLNLRLLYGDVPPVHVSNDQGMKIGVVPFAIIPSDPFEQFCVSYSIDFKFVCLEVLGSRGAYSPQGAR